MALSEDRGGGLQTQPRHLQKRLILYVFGICCGSTSFGYAAAIIATTLGNHSFAQVTLGRIKAEWCHRATFLSDIHEVRHQS